MRDYDPLDAEADPFHPPAIPTLVACLHCGQEYDSYRIEWRIEQSADGQSHGFWCCPIAGCDGRGFGFDIFPLDRDYRDENGDRLWCDDDEESDESDDLDEDEADDEALPAGDEEEPGEPPPDDDEARPW